MAAIVVSITNDDADRSVTLKQYTHDNNKKNLDPAATVVVLEPGAGTALTVLDNSVLVLRENSVAEPDIEQSVAHLATEVTVTVESP